MKVEVLEVEGEGDGRKPMKREEKHTKNPMEQKICHHAERV